MTNFRVILLLLLGVAAGFAQAPATEQSSGPMSVAQAAEHFESLLEPARAKPEKSEDTDEPQPAEEAESESEAEQEAEEEDESEEADAEDENEEKPELHTVKVDGKEVQVPLDELVKGYQREADYTRKTMALAEQRKAAESEFQAVRSEREHYSKMLGTLQAQIQQGEPQIDWARLEAENPAEWTRQRLLQQDRHQARQNIAAEQARVAGLAQAEEEQATVTRLAEEEQKLIAAVPEWKDKGQADAEKAKLVAFAQERGYSADEITSVMDSRAILLLRDAMRFRDLSQKRANLKPVPVVTTKAAKPGPPAQSQTSGLAKAQQRLAKTGKVADAAALFERFI